MIYPLVLLFALLTACATVSASPSSSLLDLLIKDFASAAKNFDNAAASAQAGSATQTKLQVAAQCMKDNVARLTAQSQLGSNDVTGLVSAGSVVYIDDLLLQEKLALAATGTAACDQLTGQIVRGINAQALRALPSLLIKLP